MKRPHTLVLPYARQPRRVRVWLPKAVEERPSVLVLFDGQNVLDDAGSFAGGWHAHAAVERLPRTVRHPVLVAVDHGGQARMHELWDDVDTFLGFVVRRVLPAAEHAIERRFDPSARAIGGASLGGLASLLAVARHPDVFSRAVAMSPSVWIAPERILGELDRAPFAPGARLYVDVGLRESDRMIGNARLTVRVLGRRLPREQVLFRPDRRGKHREKDWRRRLPKALRFVLHRTSIFR